MNIRETKSAHKIIPIFIGWSNVYLLTNGKNNILIDTSIKRNWKKIDKKLEELNIFHIDYLVLTHTHYDHVENASMIKEKYNAKVIVNKNGIENLTSGDTQTLKGTNCLVRFANLLSKLIKGKTHYQGCGYDLLVDSYLDLKAFGFNAYIIDTPGHTQDSMSLIIDDEIAIVGDTMFGILKWHIMPLFVDNMNQLIKSWGVLLNTACAEFIPSHGGAIKRALVVKEYQKRKTNID